MQTKQTPNELGYYLPAEWETHEATWISWPKDEESFPGEKLKSVEQIYVKMIYALSESEKVNVLVNDKLTEEKVRKMLDGSANFDNVVFHHIKSVDVWTRDYCPIFIKNKEKVAATKWIFNAWGGKYEELKADNQAGEEVAKKSGLEVFHPGIILEGGSIDSNGKGTIITTEQCLLNKNRNHSLSKAQIEKYLKDYLGAEKIIWLKEGIAGDDTDGHVDDIARFVSEDTVLCAYEENKDDCNYKLLKENIEILKKAGLKVIATTMPKPIKADGRILPASYSNFYIANKVVLVPIFGDKENDEIALGLLKSVFRDRKVVGINCTDLVYGFGAIHCVTMQQVK
ncbi:MAG: agmatine deiminase family protein [Candidatus Micrarchaeota archaeon]